MIRAKHINNGLFDACHNACQKLALNAGDNVVMLTPRAYEELLRETQRLNHLEKTAASTLCRAGVDCEIKFGWPGHIESMRESIDRDMETNGP